MGRSTSLPGPAFDLSVSARRTFDRLVLAGVVLLYAVLAARRLDVPVPGYDEAIYVAPALAVLRAATAGAPRSWPLMVMSYVGCPMSYVIAPFIGIWGVGVSTLRLPAVAVALAAVLLLLYLAAKIFPRVPLWAPAAACLLNSAFLISSRTGLYVDVSIHWLLLSLVLLCLWRWSLTRRPLPVFSAFLAAGFGIYSKIIFVWFAFAAAMVVERRTRRDGRASRVRLACLCASGLFIGALPLVIYNVRSGWPTAAVVSASWLRPGDPASASNLDLLRNLAARWDHLRLLLNGNISFRSNLARAISGELFAVFFAAGFVLFRKRPQRAAFGVAGVFIAAFFIGSLFTITGRYAQHLYPILPLLLVLGGVSLAALIPDRLALLPACALLSFPQVKHFNDYMEAAARETGPGSPRALSSLSEYLASAGAARPSALDWGLSHPLLVASGGMVSPRDDFDGPPRTLAPGSVAVCLWKPREAGRFQEGCDRLLNSPAFVLGEVRKFPGAPDAPVYAAIQVLDVR